MKITDLINEADLQRGIDEKLINTRSADDGQLIYNYSDAAMYTPGAWENPAVRQCRGLITRTDGEVAARPWAKFFNNGQIEAGELDLDAAVEVTDKMDGSLGILHLTEDGRLRVATRGSFESDQAIHATEWIRKNHKPEQPYLDHLKEITPLFEIVYPENRIVLNYGDRDELVLLGAVHIETGKYIGPDMAAVLLGWEGSQAQTFQYQTLREALAADPREGAEGLCVRFLDEAKIVKIKQDDYVALHKIVTGLSERSVWEHMVEGKELGSLLGPLPDELHPWTRKVWAGLNAKAVDTLIRADLIHDNILVRLGSNKGDRRAYAELAMNYPDLRSYLFMILDGKDPLPAIRKSLKPRGDNRAKTLTEATA